MGGGTYPSDWGGTDQQRRDAGESTTSSGNISVDSSGKGIAGSGDSSSGSSNSSSSTSETTKSYYGAVPEGADEAHFHATGQLISDGGSSSKSSSVGQADKPGEAKAKMIAAGVMKPSGEMKNIVGYYIDPNTGTKKFIAEDEAIPTFAKNINDGDTDNEWKEKQKEKIKIYRDTGLMPNQDINMGYTSGSIWSDSIFDPQPKPVTDRFTDWYNRQKTKVGLGGEPQAKEYEQSVKEYKNLQFMGTPDQIVAKGKELESKYSAYESAKGTSPLSGRDIDITKTWAHKSHTVAENIRADKPTYGGWQGKLSGVINEAIASNVEFLGSAPTLIKYGVPEIIKSPSLILPLAAVSGIEMGKSIINDPIQSGATMAVTGGLIKGGAKVGKFGYGYTPKPIYKSGIVGLKSGKSGYKGLVDLKTMEYMFETPKHLKGGSFKSPSNIGKVSVEGLKIQELMPKLPSKSLIVRSPSGKSSSFKLTSEPEIISQAKNIMKDSSLKSDIAYRKSMKESRTDFVENIKKNIMEKEAIRIIGKKQKVSKSDLRYKKDVKESRTEFMNELQRNIMEKEAIKIIGKKKKVSKSDLAYYRTRKGITEDVIRKAKEDIMMKDVMQIINRGEKFKSGIEIPSIQLGKMGSRYTVKKPFKPALQESSTYKLPSVKKQEIGVDVKGCKIDWETYKSPLPKKSMKLESLSFISLFNKEHSFIPKDKTDFDFYKQLKPIKKSKRRYSVKGVSQTSVLPKYKPAPITEPKTFTQTQTKYQEKDIGYIPITPTPTITKFKPKEKIPKIPFVLPKPKSKKRRQKKRTTKLAKEDIVNPIASVEQFMRQVIK